MICDGEIPMGSAIESEIIKGKKRIVGHAALGYRDGVTGSVRQQTMMGPKARSRTGRFMGREMIHD